MNHSLTIFRTQTIRYFHASLAPWKHQILLLIGVFAGAWAGVFGRVAQQEHIPTPIIIAFRMLGGALVLTPFVFQYHRHDLSKLKRREILFAAGAGFWFAVHLLSGFASIEYTTLLVSSVLSGTAPVWIALIETRVLKTRLTQVIWIGLILTLTGSGIIALAGSTDLHLGSNPALGSILSLIAAITGSFYILIGRKSRGEGRIPFLPYLWLLFLSGGVTSLFIVGVKGETFLGYSAKGYLALIMLTVLPQLIGHTIFNHTLRRLSATYVSVIGQLNIVLNGILAFLIFSEIPTALQLVGSAIIIIGITLVNLGKAKTDP